MKKILLSLWVIVGLPGWLLVAQPPAGYYRDAEGLTGLALQQALHNIIDEHKVLSYADLWDCFKTTDVRKDGTVWDIYSDTPGKTPPYVYLISTNQCGNYAREGDCYNREHSFPKSWFGDGEPMYTDLFHIYPTDGWVNNKRGNLPYGETKTPGWSSLNGSMTGPSSVPGYNGEIFEPIDEYKGDLARTFFYMATRYLGESSSWPGSDMVAGSKLKRWALQMLMRCHDQDPVSVKETDRNNSVFARQQNRNPFIDEPRYVKLIWDLANAAFISEKPEARLELWPNPASHYVKVRLPGAPRQQQTVILTDLIGTEIFRKVSRDEVLEINVAHFRPGIYLVRVITAQESWSSSFVRIQ